MEERRVGEIGEVDEKGDVEAREVDLEVKTVVVEGETEEGKEVEEKEEETVEAESSRTLRLLIFCELFLRLPNYSLQIQS